MIINSPEFTSYTSFITIDALLNGRFDIFLDALRHMVLPIITLSYINWALFLRVMRSSMLEALNQDYVTTARAKGMREKDVINKHARPNALIPVVTMAGITIAGLLGGVTITETIFNYPGIGSAGRFSGCPAGRDHRFGVCTPDRVDHAGFESDRGYHLRVPRPARSVCHKKENDGRLSN